MPSTSGWPQSELARSTDQRVALVYIDLDNFKTLNDTFGHAAGDGLLRQVASRLQSVMRRSDSISRMGGDEFAVILRQNMDDEALSQYGERIISVFELPIPKPVRQVNVTCAGALRPFPTTPGHGCPGQQRRHGDVPRQGSWAEPLRAL